MNEMLILKWINQLELDSIKISQFLNKLERQISRKSGPSWRSNYLNNSNNNI